MDSIEYEIRARLYRNIAAALLLAAKQEDEAAAARRAEEKAGSMPRETRVVELVRQMVADQMHITLANLDGASSMRSSSWGRQYCWLILYKLPLGFDTKELARMFGRKSHGTVVHGIKAAEERLASDAWELEWLSDIHTEACRILGIDPSHIPSLQKVEPRA